MRSIKSKTLTLVMIAVVLLAIALMLRLGVWQLQRAEEKQQQLDDINLRNQGTELTLEEISGLGKVQGQPVSFYGELMPEKLFYWDNRVVNGAAGYEVIVPVQTHLGIVLTNWGWVKGLAYRDQLPRVSFPSKVDVFKGVAWQPGKNRFISTAALNTTGLAHWPKVIQSVDSTLLQGLFDTPLLPFGVVLTKPKNPNLVNNYHPVVMPPEKHIAYAVQWFGLALACAVVVIVSIRKNGLSLKRGKHE
ncbi:SURF1 family protein [Alteromonas sp. a30]|uniref:SURF1 family protein n=1 Tax=Alteromonas sp. a30 TaxID=2730917 RepID=UPI0022817415|nr:SURF1 family protein [Alteromonas sp. a30]MCY7295728.1 SURF1 family protein [Alteromonas sp. a30]